MGEHWQDRLYRMLMLCSSLSSLCSTPIWPGSSSLLFATDTTQRARFDIHPSTTTSTMGQLYAPPLHRSVHTTCTMQTHNHKMTSLANLAGARSAAYSLHPRQRAQRRMLGLPPRPRHQRRACIVQQLAPLCDLLV